MCVARARVLVQLNNLPFTVPNRIINVAGAKWIDGTKTATKVRFSRAFSAELN